MTLTTTTYATIRDRIIRNLIDATPNALAERKFNRAPRRHPIREFPAVGTEAGFRLFEVTRGAGSEPGLLDPSAFLRSEILTVTVAYPLLRAIYGNEDLDDVEDVIRQDARQIRDLVFSADNYVDGQQAALPLDLPEPDKTDPECWFQDVSFDLRFYEAQSL